MIGSASLAIHLKWLITDASATFLESTQMVKDNLWKNWPATDGHGAREPTLMMTNRFEDLWNSGDDGASSPISPSGFHGEADFDGLLDAWFVERQHAIEFEILLDESKKLIRRLLAEADLSPESRRSARRLIRAITETLRTAESGRD